jgi:hypothetical protein
MSDTPIDLDLRPQAVIRTGQLHQLIADVVAITTKANTKRITHSDEGALFDVGGRPAYVTDVVDDSGVTRRGISIVPASADLSRVLESMVAFVRPTKDGGFTPADSPPRVAGWLWGVQPSRWGCPPLELVSAVPLLRHDGTITGARGYDRRARAWVDADPAVLKRVPANPGGVEAAAAADRLGELLGEFPWADVASATNYVAMLLTVTGRSVLDGLTPLAAFDANLPGSGKGLLVDILGAVGTGLSPPAMSLPSNEDEVRKQITSKLLLGPTVVKVDNIVGAVSSPSLARLSTTRMWEDRELGRSRMVVVPNRALWVLNGNNLTLTGDLPRRIVLVRLRSDNPEPWRRTDFRIADLFGHVLAERPGIVADLLTMWRAWLRLPHDERPGTTRTLGGGFESWSRAVGGVLSLAGWSNFLGNGDEIDRTDVDAEYRELLLESLDQLFAGVTFYAGDIVTVLAGHHTSDPLAREELADAVHALVPGLDTGRLNVQLGTLFRELVDRPVRTADGVLTLRRAGRDEKRHRVRWEIERSSRTNLGTPSRH